MSDKYRKWVATLLAPIIGFIAVYLIYHYLGTLCDIGPGCLGWGPILVIIYLVYSVFASVFIATVIDRAKKFSINDCLNFWMFVRTPILLSIILTFAFFIYSLNYKLPESFRDWIEYFLFLLLPIIAVVTSYCCWYLIAGRYNKTLRNNK
ncbi:MAG: hypothetical protein AAF304_00070 [Pseudomonadota bacterium]